MLGVGSTDHIDLHSTGAATGGGLFGGNKPGGFGTGTTGLGTGSTFGTGLGAGATTGGLFGSQPGKPGFNFNTTGTAGSESTST